MNEMIGEAASRDAGAFRAGHQLRSRAADGGRS
jgi:hypothetical protein